MTPVSANRKDTDAAAASVPDSLLSVEQVAAWLNVPKGWVYERVRRGELPFLRLGRYLRFERASVSAHLAAHAHTS